jgi:hypothetical protein
MTSMNCQEFERTIIDFGRDHLMEASAHARALEHAETCAPCAARLNRERQMTAGLQKLAVEEAAINAPERVRSALRAAFDDQQAAAAALPVLPWSARRKLLWGMTVAAMLLLSTTITALWLREPSVRVDNKHADVIDHPPPQNPLENPPGALVGVQRASVVHSPKVLRPSARGGRRRTPPVKEGADTAGEFFPLTFVAKSGPAEFVQTVRVEISRSMLLSMGLPVNIDRGEGLIKADIIIGEDGVARAVRIIN